MTFKEFKSKTAALSARVEALIGNAASAPKAVMLGWLHEGLNCYRNGDRHGACACQARVQFALEDMDRLRAAAPDAFSALRTQLRRPGQREDYFRVRQEIRTAASLSQKGLRFEKTERPDFVAATDAGPFGIESTSCQLAQDLSTEKDVVYKVEAALAKKAKMSYALSPVVLEMDVTNVLFHARQAAAATVLLSGERPASLQPLVDDSPFDSLLLFCYATTFAASSTGDLSATLTSVYMRVDRTTGLAPAVATYLQTHFPLGAWQRLATVYRSV